MSTALLHQVIWKRFRATDDPEEFTRHWLALQCRFIDGATSGVVVLGEPDVGPFSPVAYWPDESTREPRLLAAAEKAMAERQGVALGGAEDNGDVASVAYPITVDERLVGVVALTVRGAHSRFRDLMRHLQWGIGWIEVLLRREETRGDEEEHERVRAAFDLIAAVLEHERFGDACSAVVTELAIRLDCDPVSIGFVRRNRAVVRAISNAAQFERKMNLVRVVGWAMDEAIDQRAVVLYPSREDWEYRVTRAHAELASSHQAGSVLTVPLHSPGRVYGALCFERPPGGEFDEVTVELCDAVAGVIGPILDEKRRNDRWIWTKIVESLWTQLKRLLGPHYFGRKLATLIFVAVVAFFAIAEGEYRVTSPAVLEGRIQRTVVAPFDGYLASQHARAGEIVRKGGLLATLDDKDLALERLRWSTERRQHLAEYDKALAERERSQAAIYRAQIDQADAQIALLDEQLARTRIEAPFDGVLVSGDLTQAVGSTVERGQELFKIAPLAAYRVRLEVDERDVADVQPGQEGVLRIASMPEEPLDYTIEAVTPIAEQAEGRNFYQVEGRLDRVDQRLRPGMEGVAKTRVEERLLIRIWTERLLDWVRLTLWKWFP